jgi:hypothetical protein
MTITKRFLSVAYLIFLLAVGVVLAAALLLDGERNAGSPKKNTSQINRNTTLPAQSGRRLPHA